MRALLVVVAVLVLAAPAHAWTTMPRPASPHGYDAIGSDGARWAVAQYGGSAIAVFDDRDPGWRIVPTAADCAFDGAVGDGRALLQCPGPDFTKALTLIDLRTGVPTVVPRPAGYEHQDFFGIRIGSRWLEVNLTGYHFSLTRYLRISDGAIRAVDAPRRVGDLDAARVDQPLCAPLRRPSIERDIDNTDPYGDLAPDGHSYVFATHAGAEPEPDSVFVQRCGERHRHRLLHCACFAFQAGGGIVTSQGNGVVRVIRLRDRRTRALPIDPALRAVHTRHHLVAAGLTTLAYEGL